MLDQAHKLRQLATDAFACPAAPGPLPPTIVVTGGKGGVGTTTVAINLAAALSGRGHRTVLVDAAANPDAALLAGVDISSGPSLADVLAGTAAAVDALRPGPAGSLLLASRWGDDVFGRSPRTLDRFLLQLQSLREQTDVLVVDTGSGRNEVTRRLWQEASLVLLVTTSDDVAVMDAYATVKACAPVDSDIDVRALVNRCDTAALDDDVQRRLANACQRFLGRSLGRAPRLPRHATRSDASMTVPRAWEETRSPFGRSVDQLSRFAADVLSQQRWSGGELNNDIVLTHEFSTC